MMTYPVLLMVVSSSVLVALVLFVLPRFAQVFEQTSSPLRVVGERRHPGVVPLGGFDIADFRRC